MDVLYLMKQEMLRRGLSHRTIVTYIQCVKEFLRKCHLEPRKITKSDIKQYINSLVSKGAAGNTINVHLNALKFLMEEILCKRVLFNIKYSKVPKELPTVLTKEEVKSLFDAIKNNKHNLMIRLMYSSGLRLSELINLKIKDLEFEKNYGWVRKGKGNKDRLFILADGLKKELQNFIADEKLEYDDFLFKGRNLGHIHQRTIQEIIKKAAKKAIIHKNVHPHTLRHSFATHLIEDGYDIASVQSLLGHSSSETTMRYIHMASPRLINVKSPYDTLSSSVQ